MKYFILVLILLAARMLSFSQIETNLPVEKYQADFDIFRKIFETANSGLYKYHSKKNIDSLFDANRKKVKPGISLREFYNIAWNVIDYTGSCHNSLQFPDTLEKAIKQRTIFFPVPLKYLSGKLYSNFASDQIPTGSEIISINNIPAMQFARVTSRYNSTDGYNTTGKFAYIETRGFPYFIYLAYGTSEKFDIVFRHNKIARKIILNAVDYEGAIVNYGNRYVPAYQENNRERYSFSYINDQTGLLTVNTFAFGGLKNERHKKFAAFLDSVFADLQQKDISGLIVDVRQNGGGSDPNDLLLYSYLTKRNFRENRSAFTIFNTVPLKQYFVEEDEDEIKDLEEELKEEHSEFKNGKYYQSDSFNKTWRPSPLAFKGKIILLIGPKVASAASLFASMVRSDKHSIVIGQEALGGYYGHTGHIPVKYKLPATGLLVTFSIVDLEQDVRWLADHRYGDGVKPLYKVEQTIQDYLSGKDTVLEFGKRMAGKKTIPGKSDISNPNAPCEK